MPTYSRTQTIEHAIGERGMFELKVTSADTDVRGSPGDTARVHATFELKASSEEDADRVFETIQLRVERGEGSLRVSEREQPSLASAITGLLSGASYQLELSVEVPTSADVRLEGVSADMRVDGVHGDQRYSTVSGDLYLTDLSGDVRMNTVSGDVTARGTDSIAVRAHAVSGDLSVAVPDLRGLSITTVSGDVEVEGELTGDGEYRVETVSGDLTVGLLGSAAFEVRGLSTDINSDLDHRIEGRLDRRRVVIGSGSPQFFFNSMSGDISIRRPRRVERRASSGASSGAPSAPEDQLAVLRALERGEIDVNEATRRLSGGGSDG